MFVCESYRKVRLKLCSSQTDTLLFSVRLPQAHAAHTAGPSKQGPKRAGMLMMAAAVVAGAVIAAIVVRNVSWLSLSVLMDSK